MTHGIRNEQANRYYAALTPGRRRKLQKAVERLWFKLDALKRSDPGARLPPSYIRRDMACCGRGEFAIVERILLHNELLTICEDGQNWSVQGVSFPWDETP